MQAHTASDSPRRGRRGRGAYLPDRLGSSLPASAQIGLRRRTQLTPRIRLYPNCISELIPAAALLSPPARQQRSSSHTRDSLASETVGRTKDRYMAKGRYKRRGTRSLRSSAAFPMRSSAPQIQVCPSAGNNTRSICNPLGVVTGHSVLGQKHPGGEEEAVFGPALLNGLRQSGEFLRGENSPPGVQPTSNKEPTVRNDQAP